MTVIRLLGRVIGLLAILMGLLWIGQGTGLIMWPQDSFMLADKTWAINGAILAVAGVILIALTRRRQRR